VRYNADGDVLQGVVHRSRVWEAMTRIARVPRSITLLLKGLRQSHVETASARGRRATKTVRRKI